MTERLHTVILLPSFEKDFQVGDLVKVRGSRGVAVVERVNLDPITFRPLTALVSWNKDKKSVLPLLCLSRCPSGGDKYDRRDPK